MQIDGAKCLVTGGGTGIGRAIAGSLARRGAEVAIMGRRRDVLEATASELGLLALPGDVSIAADGRAAIGALVERFGRLDVLVNNAGFGHFAPLSEMDERRFQEVFATNVTGAMLMAREAARRFVEQGDGGHIVNIGSTAALKGFAGGTAYAASKFALRGMTECWRVELRPHDVRVMLINPSEVVTDFAASAGREQQASERKLHGGEIASAVVGALELDDRGFIPELSVWATNPF